MKYKIRLNQWFPNSFGLCQLTITQCLIVSLKRHIPLNFSHGLNFTQICEAEVCLVFFFVSH